MSTLLHDTGFWVGAGTALAAVVAMLAVHRRSSRWWAGAGVVTSLGGLVALEAVALLPWELVAGVLALGAAGVLASRSTSVLRAAAVVPGAVLVAFAVAATAPRADAWIPVMAGVTAGATALPCRTFDATWPRLTGVCLAVAAFGVFVTVPDTEAARALVGAAAVSALLGLAPDARAAAGGSAAVPGLLAFCAAVGGWPRPGAVIGGLACVGVLGLGPLLRHAHPPATLVVVTQVVLVALVARVAGLRQSASAAAVIVAVVYAAAIVAAFTAVRRRGSRQH